MYKLEIQTRCSKRIVEEPVDVRINSLDNFNIIEILGKDNNWKFLYRFFALRCPDEQKDINENVLREIKEGIKQRKGHIFIDV